jgi:heme exporter protein D
MVEFFDMGGYGAFIWTSYGVSAVILTSLVVTSVLRLKKTERALAPLEQVKRDQRKRPAKAGGLS